MQELRAWEKNSHINYKYTVEVCVTIDVAGESKFGMEKQAYVNV